MQLDLDDLGLVLVFRVIWDWILVISGRILTIWACFRVICSWIFMICCWFCGLRLEHEAGFGGFPGFVICGWISVICIFF